MSSAPSFAELGLAPELLRAVTEAGYTTPTPIQQQAIPVVLAGRDVMGGAQTGTGKTAGFALPILHKLLPQANTSPSPARHPVRALILAPTRELAIQVEEAVKTYGKYTGIRSTCVFGGVDIKQQLPIVRAGVEILVATPGRLLDHIEQKSVHLGQVEIFVLDEADRMLDMGFIPDIKRIMALMPVTAKRQNLLFSATFSGEIKKLADALLNAPQLIEVARRNTAAETVVQSAYKCPQDSKRLLLEHIVRSRGLKQVLCFVRTKHGASRLARQLEKDGLVTSAIHGDKTQAARLEALAAFKDAKLEVLVATDVAARGLDIDDLPLVVNYELPHDPEDYIHRIGRTARAGATGEAISLVDPAEMKYLTEIEKLLKRTIPFRRSTTSTSARPRDANAASAGSAARAAAPKPRRAASVPSARPAPSVRRGAPCAADPAEPSPAGPRSRSTREAEREAAYAKNPDQPESARRSAEDAHAHKAAAHAGASHRRGFGANRPVPALLMKRTTAPATPSAPDAPVRTPDAAPEERPGAASETEKA
ncbi:MAG: DEAD/DEAH box helicase [Betaproteobacteria bacterium]|nr:DEAD/DEAH box helicase [Betaproteobacteria bacterium]